MANTAALLVTDWWRNDRRQRCYYK